MFIFLYTVALRTEFSCSVADPDPFRSDQQHFAWSGFFCLPNSKHDLGSRSGIILTSPDLDPENFVPRAYSILNKIPRLIIINLKIQMTYNLSTYRISTVLYSWVRWVTGGIWEIPYTKVNQVDASYTGRTVHMQGRAPWDILTLWSLHHSYKTNSGSIPPPPRQHLMHDDTAGRQVYCLILLKTQDTVTNPISNKRHIWRQTS